MKSKLRLLSLVVLLVVPLTLIFVKSQERVYLKFFSKTEGAWLDGDDKHNDSVRAKIVQIGECNYVLAIVYRGAGASNVSFAIIHRGDCPNPVHKK